MEEVTAEEAFNAGFTAATLSSIEIWQEMVATLSPEEVVAQFGLFMVMCELRLNGAEWSEMATVAELNENIELAENLRKRS